MDEDVKSVFLKWSKSDFVKGLVMAILGGALGTVYGAIEAGTLLSMAVLKTAGNSALLAAITYLTKNLLTNSQGQFAKPESK